MVPGPHLSPPAGAIEIRAASVSTASNGLQQGATGTLFGSHGSPVLSYWLRWNHNPCVGGSSPPPATETDRWMCKRRKEILLVALLTVTRSSAVLCQGPRLARRSRSARSMAVTVSAGTPVRLAYSDHRPEAAWT